MKDYVEVITNKLESVFIKRDKIVTLSILTQASKTENCTTFNVLIECISRKDCYTKSFDTRENAQKERKRIIEGRDID